MIDLSGYIKNLKIDPAIMTASGILSFLSVLERIEYFGAVVLKSIGINERNGNETPIIVQCSDEAYLNAVGLPGPGYKGLKLELEEYYPRFRSTGRPLGLSIFGENPEELIEIAKHLKGLYDFLEVNFSCSNRVGDEKAMVTIGSDPELVKKYLYAVKNAVPDEIVVAKLPPGPYIDERERIKGIARAAADTGADAISAINTISGGMKIDIYARRPVLSARYGGMSGPAIKPIGVGCVYTMREAVDIPIIGGGGIRTAEDVVEYIEAGADAVFIGTELRDKTTEEIKQYISNLIKDLGSLVEQLGAESLRELKGVAHV